jgi:N-acylneuraminate cytidylyltransferase
MIAVIPARGGSKRIPRKNLVPFHGQPMIAWPIKAAKACGLFDHIIVSTDDAEIADVARACGADVPFVRPSELADDFTGTVPVVAHAIEEMHSMGVRPSHVCCIYATAPFVRAVDLERGFETLRASGASYAVPVARFPYPVQRAMTIVGNGHLAMMHPELAGTRSQDLEESWHDAGQFYWGTVAAWLERLPILSSGPVPVPLERHRVQDIDTPEDLRFAEILFKAISDQESVR